MAEAFSASRTPRAEHAAIEDRCRLLGGLGGDLQRVVDILEVELDALTEANSEPAVAAS